LYKFALQSLVYERGKLVVSVVGVAIATALLLSQIGILEGMKVASSRVIRHFGGDIWVMARGTNVLDNAETISAGVRSLIMAHPCIRTARGLIYALTYARRHDGSYESVIVVGSDSTQSDPLFPWRMIAGLPSNLKNPQAVTVDSRDAKKLALPRNAVGETFELAGQNAHVVGVTQGIRSVMVMPYLFTSLRNARGFLELAEGQVSHWVLHLTHPSCQQDVISWIERHPDLQALPTATWAKMTEDYWVRESGAGSLLGLTAALGLVVGVVIVGQTLYALTQEHFQELAMLRVLGARSHELAGFVAWQVLAIGALGSLIGIGLAFILQYVMEQSDLEVNLSQPVLLTGLAVVVGMCAVSAANSVRAVICIKGTEVFA
jgi:putative ABC transport system permease protein